jgi:AsmA protein
MRKKFLISIGVVFLLLVVAAIVVPFVVDVDKFRPKIVQAVNEQINGEFKLGKLELSLWSGINVNIESLSIQIKGETKPFLENRSAHLHISLMSVVTMHPSVTIVLSQPSMALVKEKNGKLNVMALLKAMPELPAGTPPPPKSAPKTESALPAIVANASIGVRIEKAVVSFKDEVSGSQFSFDGMDADVENLGLKETIKAAVTLPLKGHASGLEFGGIIQANAEITPTLEGTKFRSATGKVEVDASQFSFEMNHGMVAKPVKVPLLFSTEFVGSTNELQIKTMNFKLQELVVDTKGVITLQPKMAVKMEIHSSQLNLANLESIVPLLKAYQLGGMAALDVKVDGPSEQLAINGKLTIKDGKAAYSSLLKAPITYELKTSFTKNSFHLEELKVAGSGLESNLKGDVENFSAPKFNFDFSGKEIDVDKLLKAPLAPAQNAAKAEAPKAAAPVVTENPLLPLAKNPMIANAAGMISLKIAKLVAKGASITDITAKTTLKNLFLNLESASLKSFGGTLNAKFSADLKTSGLKFATSGNLKGLDSKKAIATFVPKFQNTLEGTVSGDWNMTGAAYPQPALLRSLNGTVKIAAENGQLHSIDMKESIKGVLSKVSFLKSVNPPNIDQGFKSMRVDLKFAGGVIDANPFEMIGDAKGLTVKGKSKIQETLTQDTYVDVFDPNRLLPSAISNGKDAAMQLHVTGLLSAPVTDYAYTVERLGKNIVKNQGKELLGNQLKKMFGNKGSGSGSKGGKGDALGDALKGLGF